MLNVSTSEFTRSAAWGLFICGIVSYLLLSAQSLSALGIPYDAPGGPVFAKLHPGTLLIILSFSLMLATYGHPLRVAASLTLAQPTLAVYMLGQTIVLAWMLSQHGISGAANSVDTLLMPFLCVLTLRMVDSGRRHACLVLIVTILVLNTVIGLGEAVVHARLIPFRLGGRDVIEDIFRPTALLGHPLTNSMVTATLLPAVFHLRMAPACRLLLALLLWLGVLAFGGRTAFVLSTVAYGLYGCLHVARSTLRGRYSYLQITGTALAAMLGAAAIVAIVLAGGIGERIIESLSWDGSAAVRVQIWNVLDFMDDRDMWFGMSPTRIIAIGQRIGLADSEAIENFWLTEFMQTGWIGFVPYLVAMGCLIAWLWKSTRGMMRLSVCLFFLIASSSNSLATKTNVLVLLAVVVATTRSVQLPAPLSAPRLSPAWA